MGCVIFIGVLFVISVCICITQIMDDKAKEKENRLAEIERIKSHVANEFEYMLDMAEICGDKYYKSLIDFADKMDKLSQLQSDLKPYDKYCFKKLYENTASHMASKFIGRIVIDKDLVPKFMLTAPSNMSSQLDIELKAALTSEDVRGFANKCRKAKMDADIEKFRKDKVTKALNN